MILPVIQDTLTDALKLLPFLFITYLVMEYIEHRTGEKSRLLMKKSGKWGPALGGLLGMLPQCGFSTAASNLYAAVEKPHWGSIPNAVFLRRHPTCMRAESLPWEHCLQYFYPPPMKCFLC